MPKIVLALFLFAIQTILAPDARTTSLKANRLSRNPGRAKPICMHFTRSTLDQSIDK